MSEELFRTEALRARWRRAREAVGLAGDVERGDFGIGGLARRLDAPSVRLLILPADPEKVVVEFEKELVEWWKSVSPDSTQPQALAWATRLALTADAAVRHDGREQEGWGRFIALDRQGGLEIGLGIDGARETSNKVRDFLLVSIVGRIWSGLDAYRSIIDRCGVQGPWELSIALIGTSNSVMGNVASGWDNHFSDESNRCPDRGALHRRELDAWPDEDGCRDLAFQLGGLGASGVGLLWAAAVLFISRKSCRRVRLAEIPLVGGQPSRNYFDFEVSLVEVTPRIWRRFLIRDTATFSGLHLAIQDACGWWNYHAFVFRTEFGDDEACQIAGTENDEYIEKPVPNSARVRLASYFAEGKLTRCYYHYDFGDDWWHDVVLRGTQELPETFKRRLLGGARAFPHEDCGGLSGYRDCVRAALHQDEGLDDPEGLRTWFGDWHPERFELEKTKVTFDD